MQSVVTQILQAKLQELVSVHTKLTTALDIVNSHVTKFETRAHSLVKAPLFSEDALRLGSDMDWFQSKMTDCLDAIDALDGRPQGDSQIATSRTETQSFETKNTSQTQVHATSAPDRHCSHVTTDHIFKAQLGLLQTQVSDLQGQDLDSRLQAVEKKLQKKIKAKPGLDTRSEQRLQHVEAKVTLVEGMQLRQDGCLKQSKKEMKRLDMQQNRLGERLNDVKTNTESLVKLRDILNHLKLKLTSREELVKRVGGLEGEMAKLLGEMGTSKRAQGATVDLPRNTEVRAAFVAKAKSGGIARPRGKIHFTDVCLNERNCYNSENSTFEAPVEGLYFFNVSVSTSSPGMLTLQIVHNGKSRAMCGTAGGQDEQTSASVLIRMSARDKVWVEAESQTISCGVRIGSGFSNFIGCRLR